MKVEMSLEKISYLRAMLITGVPLAYSVSTWNFSESLRADKGLDGVEIKGAEDELSE